MKEYKSPFLKLSKEDQKAALEAIIFSSHEPVSLVYLFEVLIKNHEDGKKQLSITDGINQTEIIKSVGEEDNKDVLESLLSADLNTDIAIPDKNSETENIENTVDEKKNDNSFFKTDYFAEIIDEINKELLLSTRPFQIVHVAGGYQYSTRPEYGKLAQQVTLQKQKRRFSQAALEAMAIIAYHQPVSKPEVEKIRGVNSNEVVNSLIEKGLVEISGRSEALGKPLLYSTTVEFLKTFGINHLKDLPKLREIEELTLEEPMLKTVSDVTFDITDTIKQEETEEVEDVEVNDVNFRRLQNEIEKGIEIKDKYDLT